MDRRCRRIPPQRRPVVVTFNPPGRFAAGLIGSDRVITYRLSGRQAKEIVARGQRLRIAIPEPPDLPDDVELIEFARESLPGAPGEIVEAERIELSVEAATGTPGLAGVLGAIQELPRGLCWLVPAIVATIRPAVEQRRQQMDQRIQWPASAHDSDGRRWPRGGDDADV